MYKTITKILLATLCLSGSNALFAQDSGKDRPDASVFFDCIDRGNVSVKFVPLDSSKASVIFSNNTKHDIELELPASFGAINVLGQVGGGLPGVGQGAGFGNGQGGQFAGGGGGGGVAGGGQQLGGGFGQGGGGNIGGGPGGGAGNFGAGAGFNGGGLFRIPAGKTKRLSVKTVCLEFGKPDPNPRMNYRIVPLKRVSTSQSIQTLCEKLGSGELQQKVAQAAAWHWTDNLSWHRLARLNQVESRYTGNRKRFTKSVLGDAKKLVNELEKQDEVSPGVLVSKLNLD